MTDWFIKKLGGYTRAEYRANREGFERTVELMKAADRITLMMPGSMLNQASVNGPLVVAPDSGACIIGCYFEQPMMS